MQEGNLKALFMTAFCFIVALCSEIRCMDTASDLQEPTSYKAQNNHSGNYLDSLKPEIDNSLHDAMSPLNQDENESSSTSWVSYVSSTVKGFINRTYNVVDFSMKHPARAMITSLFIAAQFTDVAAKCNCIYTAYQNGSGYVPFSLGTVPDEAACMRAMNQTGFISHKWGCY